MMATTHALVGFVLGAVAMAFGLPAHLAVPAAVLGSVVPDLDLYYGHRRTLHYPIGFPLAAVGSGTLAILAGGSLALVLATVVLFAAAVHVGLDVLGGGLELRPWEGTSDRAVYDHVRGRWIPPRRWVPYDGSPEDLAVAGVLTTFAAPFYDGVWLTLMLVLVGISFVYVALRRRLAAYAPVVVGRLPKTVRERVPGRYVE